MQRKELVKVKCKDKKMQELIDNAIYENKVTIYVIHKKTGAIIPVDNEFYKRVKDGEIFELSEIERKYDRRFFKANNLEIRWNMDMKDIIKILNKYDIPCFIELNKLNKDKIKYEPKDDEICVFEEYVLALEKKVKFNK